MVEQVSSANSRAPHGTHSVGAAGFGDKGVHGPQIVMEVLLAQVIQVVPPEHPPRLLCPHSAAMPPLPVLCPCAKSVVQNYVFKYLGFHQLCKLSPSIKAAIWVLCWQAGLCQASGWLCSSQPWPQGMQPGNGT